MHCTVIINTILLCIVNQNETYYVNIETTIKHGVMNYAELIIPGESKEEILLSTYIWHPSMRNNELSGPVLTTYLSKHILCMKPYYSYRILFIPDRSGALTY